MEGSLLLHHRLPLSPNIWRTPASLCAVFLEGVYTSPEDYLRRRGSRYGALIRQRSLTHH